MIYRVAFTGRGAEYTRCFTSKEERDRFAESMRQAGYKVHAWEQEEKNMDKQVVTMAVVTDKEGTEKDALHGL